MSFKKLLLSVGLILAPVFCLAEAGSFSDYKNRREFHFVYNADNVAHEVGDVVVWSDASLNKISTTTTANNGLVAGVVAENDIAAGGYGLIQTYGYHATLTTDGNVVAGDSLVTSTTGEACGQYTIAMATGTAANQAAIFGIFGTATATDSGTVGQVFIHLK